MDNNIFNEINTTLDLNGPILSFSSQPTGGTGIGTTAGATGGASISFTGISTAVDPGTGYVSYQWYEVDVGKLSDDTYITGTASTGPVGTAATLTVSNLITPRDNQRKFYVEADYVHSAYGVGKSTGNAINEPLTSGIATVTVTPLIEIVSQPAEGVQALINENATITVNADLTDSYFSDDLLYQWYLNGEAVTDGTKTTTVTTSATVPGTVETTYTSDGSASVPGTSTDIEVTVCGAQGGSGGDDAGGPGGSGGDGKCGKFSLPASAKELVFKIGTRGNGGTSGNQNAFGIGGAVTGTGNGGNGGGAGQDGYSGGGGGGGAASKVLLDTDLILIAAGGGGGGGGSHNVAGGDGSDGNDFESESGFPSEHNGNVGDDASEDGGGGGGGGAGSTGGSAGSSGADNQSASTGGGGGSGKYTTSQATLVSQWLNQGDGYAHLKYTGYTDQEVTTTRNTILSGTTSNTLTISADIVGVQTCQCKITSATASNSPIWTDVTNFATTSTLDRYNVNVEAIGIGQTATLSSINLSNGDYSFDTTQSQVSSGGITKYYSFYAPDKDIDVEMDLYGGKADDKGSYTGGEGGYSRIRFTMKKNEEYVIVGLSSDLNAPYLYRKGALMACVGAGGDAGTSGDGGNGGGVSNEGQDGGGRDAGIGGVAIAAGTIGANGTFGSQYSAGTVYTGDTQATGQEGGQTIRCTKGVYWAQQGIAACTDMTGTNAFKLSDGTEVANTASITRGFKAGYSIIETAGAKDANGGIGGNGVTGGSGGSQGGGGGGSGYNDGSVTVVDTQQGGSAANAKVILRVVT